MFHLYSVVVQQQLMNPYLCDKFVGSTKKKLKHNIILRQTILLSLPLLTYSFTRQENYS